jgi:DNA polymerase III epsilon subunit-like protein
VSIGLSTTHGRWSISSDVTSETGVRLINYNTIICVDFETTSLDRETCEIWQIAAVPIRPRDLQVIDTHFDVKMRVERPDDANPESLQLSRVTIEKIMKGVDPREAWHSFAEWCSQFNLGGKSDLFNCPIMAGHNIVNFDRHIYERYCHLYKTLKRDKKLDKNVPGIFNPQKHYDTFQLMSYWAENLKEPKSQALSNLRKYMGMPQIAIDNAHDALQDARDTAAILQRLLRLSRSVAPKVKFKDCFNLTAPPEAVPYQKPNSRPKSRPRVGI